MSRDESDDELVRRSLAGEASAFAQLVEKHQRLVFGVALSGARDVAQAEDVAQQAFVEAWRDLPRLRDRTRVGSWIAGIARNLGRRWDRHTARRRKRETSAIDAHETVPTPLDSTLERETQSVVREALEEIPAAYREALVLYYVHGRSIAEVAAGLGIKEDLVKQRLSRGRRALRASLETRLEDALEQLRPSKGFTATVMVAVGTTTARDAAAAGATGKALVAMKSTKLAVIGTAIFVVGGAAWYWRASEASEPPRVAAKPAPSPASTSPAAAASSQAAGAPTDAKATAREARAKLLQAIRSANQLRAASAPPASHASAPPAGGSADDSVDLDREYIQQAMRGVLSKVLGCYQEALKTQPALAGKLFVKFTVEAEPDVGGLVTDSSIDAEASEITDPKLGECVQDVMFDLELDPPTNGGRVEVTYPFSLQPHKVQAGGLKVRAVGSAQGH